MAYDEELAEQIRERVEGEPGVSEMRMFGGLAFLINGNMAIAASGQGGLLVRADPVEAEAWIDGDSVAPMEMRGREMKGWLRVNGKAAEDLDLWTERGVGYARSLPPKG